MSTLKQFQQIDDLTKIKISGYIREYDSNTNDDSIYHNDVLLDKREI